MRKVGCVLAGMLWCVLLSVASAQTYTPGQKVEEDFDSLARPFLVSHCGDCHGEFGAEGDLSLTDLGPVDEVNSATWKAVWAQVTLKEMPPESMEQPGVVERLRFSDWIVGELSRVMRDQGGFRAHLDPGKGNFVDHELLFGPLPDGIKLVRHLIAGAYLASNAAGTHHPPQRADQYGTEVRSGKARPPHAWRWGSHQPRR